MKTVRFSQVVNEAGTPAPHLLWTPPGQDRAFQSALKQNRVLAVHAQLRSGKKDYATVGFSDEPQAQFLVFPRSLTSFRNRRVIAIDYDLLAPAAQPEKKPPKAKPTRASAPKTKAKPPKRPPPKPAKPAQPAHKAEVVHFPTATPPAKTAPRPRSERPPPTAWPPDPLPDLRRAIKDLQAGNPVAAYDRLRALVERLEPT